MDQTTIPHWLDLPATLAALWPIISNPLTIGIIISIAAQQFGWIKANEVPNWQKLGAVWIACLAWAIFVAVFGTDGTFVITKESIYGILIASVGLLVNSQIGYYLITNLPWLKDILSALFGVPPAARIISVKASGSAPDIVVGVTDTSGSRG